MVLGTTTFVGSFKLQSENSRRSRRNRTQVLAKKMRGSDPESNSGREPEKRLVELAGSEALANHSYGSF